MSEFFKALEQAERDRARESRGGPGTAPPVARPPVRETAVRETPAPPTAPAVEEPGVVAQTPAPDAVAAPPIVKRVVSQTPSSSTPAAAASVVPPSPKSVFRPVVRRPGRSHLMSRAERKRPVLIALTNPSSIEADAYRTLRANIELMSDRTAPRHIAITSVRGGDGKSTTAANLAVVAAQAGQRVCLVDADLRRPTLHELFGLSNVEGLASALEQGKPLHTVAQSVDIDNLSVVVGGRGADEALDLLTAKRLEMVLQGLESVFDFVVFDSPPLVVSDTLNVAAVSDGVILVVSAGSIPFNVLRRAIGRIKQVNGTVLGVLLNRGDVRKSDSDSYGYYRAHHSTPTNGAG
jgi:protein-tyrosine kinase